MHFLSQYSHIWVKFRKFGEFRPIKTERRNAPIKKRFANLSSAYFICPGSRIKVFANPDPKRRFSPMCRFLSTSTLVLVLQPRAFPTNQIREFSNLNISPTAGPTSFLIADSNSTPQNLSTWKFLTSFTIWISDNNTKISPACPKWVNFEPFQNYFSDQEPFKRPRTTIPYAILHAESESAIIFSLGLVILGPFREKRPKIPTASTGSI